MRHEQAEGNILQGGKTYVTVVCPFSAVLGYSPICFQGRRPLKLPDLLLSLRESPRVGDFRSFFQLRLVTESSRTSCGHIFCQHCLEQWFRSLQSLRPVISGFRIVPKYTCPRCIAVVSSPPPPAYALRALLDSLPAGPDPEEEVAYNPDLAPRDKKPWDGLF